MENSVRTKPILLILAACLLLLELLIRTILPYLSANIEHIETIPDIEQEIARKNKSGNKTVLFLGNSLIDYAVRLDEIDLSNISGDIPHLSFFKLVPDGTSLWDWYCIAKNYFNDGEQVPHIMVIGYAWGNVPPEPSRLAGYFCRITDISDLFKLGMNSSSAVFEYLVASVSKLYALRETIRKRTLDLIIPDYRDSVREVNEANRKINTESTTAAIPLKGSQLMNRFLDLLSKRDIQPVFIAMPVVNDYPLDESIVRSIQDERGVLFDYRHLEGIDEDAFIDPIHLGERGGRVFTRRLAIDLSQIVGN